MGCLNVLYVTLAFFFFSIMSLSTFQKRFQNPPGIRVSLSGLERLHVNGAFQKQLSKLFSTLPIVCSECLYQVYDYQFHIGLLAIPLLPFNLRIAHVPSYTQRGTNECEGAESLYRVLRNALGRMINELCIHRIKKSGKALAVAEGCHCARSTYHYVLPYNAVLVLQYYRLALLLC
jgi:hypothetical protein